MADLTKLTDDLNIIAKLDDEPNDVGGLSADELKAEFDKAGNAIKTYLNDTLIPGIEGTGGEGGLVGEQIAAHNEAPEAHADIRQEVALKLDSATIKSAGIPGIVSPETLRTYFYDKRKETSRSWQFEVSSGSNENMVSALGGFPDGHTAAEKWFLYIDLPYTEAGGFVIHAQLEGRANGLLYRQDQFATLDQRWHTTGWIRIDNVQAHLDKHISDKANPHNVTLEQIGAVKAPAVSGTEGQVLTQTANGETAWRDPSALVVTLDRDIGPSTDMVRANYTPDEILEAASTRTVVAIDRSGVFSFLCFPVYNYISSVLITEADGPYYPLGPAVLFSLVADGVEQRLIIYSTKFAKHETIRLQELPKGGTDGQVLTRTSTGTPEWKDAGGLDKAAEHWATVKVAEAITEITSEDTFRTYFYNLRKSQTRKYQFEISTGGIHENIVTGVGGRPQGVRADDSAFLYVEIPFSEAGGFVIKATYELRSKAGIWEKKIYGTLDSRWQDTGWYEQNAVNAPTHTIMNVDIEDDGFGGYETIQYNDNDINNHRNAGGLVQAKYYDSKTNQTYTYYYSTMESDRKPTFIRTYVDDNGSTVQVLASVGNDKKVTVTRRVTPSIDDASAAPDKLWSAEKISKLSEENDNKYANALKGKVSAPVVAVDDVSPVAHNVVCKVSGVPDLSAVTVTRCGKNVVTSSRPRATDIKSSPFLMVTGKPITIELAGTNLDVSGNGVSIKTYPGEARIDTTEGKSKWVYTPKSTQMVIATSYRGAGYPSDADIRVAYGETSGIPQYSGETFKPNAEGNVTGMKSIAPNMTILTDNPSVTIDAEYNRDINKAFAKLEAAILSTGGNV